MCDRQAVSALWLTHNIVCTFNPPNTQLYYPCVFYLATDLQAKESLLHLAVCLRWSHLSCYLVHQTGGRTRRSSSDGEGGGSPLLPQGGGQKALFRFLIAKCSVSTYFKEENLHFGIFICAVNQIFSYF